MELGWGNIEAARLALSRLQIADSDDALERGLGAAARISAKSLGVERVGVWLFQDQGRVIQCVYQYDSRARDNVAALSSITIPSYLEALRQHRFVAVRDARTDPITRELSESYLEPLGVRSLIDAPIYRGSELIGVVCHDDERPRDWTVEERHLAATTADVVALLFEQSRRLEAEKSLRESQAKLAELALLDDVVRIGAGIAHDLNNLLTVALNGASLLETRPDDVELVRSMAREIRSVSERAVTLAQRFLTVRRSSSPPSAAIDLAEVVRELEPALTALASGVELELTVAPSPAFIDARSFEQVLFNLVKNARDASERGSRIALALAPRGAGVPEVVLEVRDEGSGMAPEVRDRATEPFFTTRGDEGGTGLGLDIVATVVRQCGGSLDIDSAPGRGTTVTVGLPAPPTIG
jgi:two-component system, cell cycle sensor histidine kinase and response regulator CckA